MWLIQKAQPAAKTLTKKQITTSALSGRTMNEIAEAGDAVWQSGGAATVRSAKRAASKRAGKRSRKP
jgi:hypothetical protein